jgi:hypothetical protein
VSLVEFAQNLKLAGDRFKYASEAVENVHMGECPEDIDEYCAKCLPKIIAVGERYEELPKFLRIYMKIFHPFKTFWAIGEFEFCQGVLAAYELGLARGRAESA